MPRVVFSKVVWAGRARALVFALVIMAAALVASLLALAVTTRSAEAAFDGDNGLIVFYSERDRKPGDIFVMSSTGDAVKRSRPSPPEAASILPSPPTAPGSLSAGAVRSG